MTSDSSPEPDPRRKRALFIGGAIALAAIAWNLDGWNDDPVQVTVVGDEDDIREARDAIRDAVREEVRAGFRGDGEEAAVKDETAEETAEGQEAAAADSEAGDTETASVEASGGERRVVETASGENQRSFRIEGDDGRGVTISIDTDGAN
ncbi:MAG: hypothetical protein AAGE05_12820 [Pseudomonadota bacterium]